MGNPTLYWYPPGAASARPLSLGARISDLQVQDVRDRQTAAPLGGTPIHHDLGGYRLITLTVDRRTTASLIRELRSLATHLQSGGYVAFCLDADKLWGGWATTTAPTAGDATVYVDTGNAFTAYASGSLAANDEVTIESPNPEMRREVAKLDSISGRTLTITNGVLQSYSTAPVFVRYADFYPALCLPADNLQQASPTTDHRIGWSWSVQLAEYPGVIEALSEQAGNLARTDSQASGVFGSLADVLGNVRRASIGRARAPTTLLSRW